MWKINRLSLISHKDDKIICHVMCVEDDDIKEKLPLDTVEWGINKSIFLKELELGMCNIIWFGFFEAGVPWRRYSSVFLYDLIEYG